MDTLRNLFGNVTATILRLALVVGTLAAVYFFAIRPVLDTTEDISNRAFEQSSQFQTDVQRSVRRSIRDTNRQVQQSVNRSLNQTQKRGGPDPQQLLRCVQRAHGNVNRLQACARRY